ncbi:MAG: hypothetical protein HKP17_07400 [Ignavibacteriaceae bacterium]|nr:hypothetical protein [Ignavibacteria bacterium]NNJ52982.1 hypothetical protein [Ignavibacteriaceae bacterium]
MIRLLLVLISALLLFACTEDAVNNPVGNQPPNTGLFLYPDSTIAPQPSRLRVHWWGDDSDGLIAGFYINWNNSSWDFTPSNDSLFALKIGANDTTYNLKVSAADDQGNNKFDEQIIRNAIDFGPEPFIDENGNGIYDDGEFFYDIGLIDPTPAEFNFPLKNSAPTIDWNELSFVPDTSFPVMSFSWIADDIDGEETIISINIALNDTLNPDNIIELDGEVRTITIRTDDFTAQNPLMEILIEGQENNIHPEPLPGLVFDDFNFFYVQAEDISGAKSNFIRLPESTPGDQWYVNKPSGTFLVIDDYGVNDGAQSFYANMFDSLGLTGNYDVYDIRNLEPPFKNVTFLETIKLFDYLFWYTDNNPSLDLASFSTQKYLTRGGKLAYSMQFPQTIDPVELQSFIPIISDSIDVNVSLLPGTEISSDTTNNTYPNLELTLNVFRVKSFYLNPLAANPIYYYPNGELKGFTGFTNSEVTQFFIALPLDRCNGGEGNVKQLFEKVLFEDFGLVP